MATSDFTRRQRVANGSRRKRDLQAAGLVAQTETAAARMVAEQEKRAKRELRLRPKLRESEAALDAWAGVHALLQADLPGPTFALWVAPLSCIGEAEGALCLSAPDHMRSWCERRYGKLIGEQVREVSDLKGIYLLRVEKPDEGDAPL